MGIFSKCEDRIYEHTVGRIETGVTDQETVLWWRERAAWPACAQCALYPSCTYLLSHCPNRPSACPEEERAHRLALCGEHMLRAYREWEQRQAEPGGDD